MKDMVDFERFNPIRFPFESHHTQVLAVSNAVLQTGVFGVAGGRWLCQNKRFQTSVSWAFTKVEMGKPWDNMGI
jgi:hypothetical protein